MLPGVTRRGFFILLGTLDIIEKSHSARLGGDSTLYWELVRMAVRVLRADKEEFVRRISEPETSVV